MPVSPLKAEKKASASRTSAKQAPPAPVQNAVVRHIAFELAQPISPAPQEEASATQAATSAVSGTSSYGVIIEDGLPLGEGQVHRSDFMEKIAQQIESAANEILAPAGQTAQNCPYLAFWLDYYRKQSAEHLERAIARYAMPVQTDRQSLEGAILKHVREATQAWVDRGEVQIPGSVLWTVADDLINSASPAQAQRMGMDGRGASAAPGSAVAIQARLGGGRPLDGDVRTRMERGFGTSFAGVRLHADAHAASLASAYQARAFTVGQSVGFAAGQYRPGTAAGDMLIAHELAHTIQQRSARVEGADGGVSDWLEFDASQAAVGALMPELGLDAMPRGSGGLELRRCGSLASSESAVDYDKTVKELRQLYIRKKAVEDGKATAAEAEQVDRRIAELTDNLERLDIHLSPKQLRKAIEAGEDLKARIGEPVFYDAEEMEAKGFWMERPPGEATVGRSYELTIHGPRYSNQDVWDSDIYSGHWYIQKPGETDLHGQEGWTGSRRSWTLDKAGDWYFAAKVRVSSDESGLLLVYVQARDPGEVATEHLDKIGATDITTFKADLDFHRLQLAQRGSVDQRIGVNRAYISLDSGTNPADFNDTNSNDIPYYHYGAHPATGLTPARYEWVAIPDDLERYDISQPIAKNPMGYHRRVIDQLEGIDKGTNPTASWWPIYPGVVDLYCKIYDTTGNSTVVQYRQVILSKFQSKDLSQFDSYAKTAREDLAELRQSDAVFIPAVHLATKTGAATELSLFVGVEASSGVKTMIIDVTPGVPRRKYDGDDFSGALADFNKGNSYPDGQIRLRVPQNNLGIKAQTWTVTTTGESVYQRLSTVAGWESLGLAGLGALSAIIPGLEPLAPVFFMASAGTGAVSAGAALYQQHLEENPDKLMVAINIAALAASLLGFAGAGNILRHGPRLAALTKVGRFVLYAEYATNVTAGVFMTAEAAEQIANILDGPGTPDEKSSAITTVLAMLGANHMMLAWGAKDLAQSRVRLAKALPAIDTTKLSTVEMNMLSVIEGSSLSRLSGASVEELQGIAAVVKEDPVRASALAKKYGEQFVIGARSGARSLDDLAAALEAGAPEAAGTRGYYGPRDPKAPRPTYVEDPSAPSTTSGLSKRVQQVFTNPASTVNIKLAEGATLRPLGGPNAKGFQTNFELTIPSKGLKPEMKIPVSIQSTDVRPMSVHGELTGPATMNVRSKVDTAGAVTYEAAIQVHQNLAKDDIGLAVAHELDELTGIATKGVRGDDITAQKRASLLKTSPAGTGAPVPSTTAHDTAQARELANYLNATGRKPDPAGAEMPSDVLGRAIDMGFGNPAYLEEKLKLLAEAGVKPDMLKRLRVMALRSEVTGALGSASLNTPKLIGHLVTEEGIKLGAPSPISGLHLDSALLERQASLVANNEKVALIRTADKPIVVNGVEYKAYQQWVWDGQGVPGPRPAGPGTFTGEIVGGWKLAPEPKTTFNDLVGFMGEAQQAWDAWRTNNPTVTGSNVQWADPRPGGVVAGYVNLNATPIVVGTTYPSLTGRITAW